MQEQSTTSTFSHKAHAFVVRHFLLFREAVHAPELIGCANVAALSYYWSLGNRETLQGEGIRQWISARVQKIGLIWAW